jgi:GTP-sensing pleiotropic transcriptional regulator CodY
MIFLMELYDKVSFIEDELMPVFTDAAASFVGEQILASRADDDKKSNKRRKLIDGAVDVSSHPAVDDAADHGHVVLCRVVINLVS